MNERRLYGLTVLMKTANDRLSRGIGTGEFMCVYWPSRGQEAITAAMNVTLRADDQLVTIYRGLHDLIGKGVVDWLPPSRVSAPGSSPTRPPQRSRPRSTLRRPRSWRPLNSLFRTRERLADFVIRIPSVSVAVSEAELTELLVDGGEYVEEGSPIYVIATEKVEQEIEAGVSGTVHWSGRIGTTYDIGAEIGVITHERY